MQYLNNIGKTIATLRKGAKLSQVECAKRIGVGLRFLREIEQGKKTARMDKVEQVLSFFGHHIEVTKNERI